MHVVAEILPVDASEEEILERAVSILYLADFSISPAVIACAKEREIQPLPVSKFEVMPGRTANAIISGMHVMVGGPKLIAEEKIAVPVSFADRIKMLVQEGKGVIVVIAGRSVGGAIVFDEVADPMPLKPEAPLGKHPTLFQRLRAAFRGKRG